MTGELRPEHLASGASGAGSSRTGIVGALLSRALIDLAAGGTESVTVLDCGGGSGTFAVPLAAASAQVTVIDISIDALAILSRRAAEACVGDRVEAIQGDVEALDDALAGRQFDLVLAHGILEVMDDPSAVFAAMAAAVRPGGLLSVLVNNPISTVFNRALAGDVQAALREYENLDTPARVGPALVHNLCAEHGFVVESVHGVGVFADFVPGTALEVPGARDALAELEIASSTRSPFADTAARQHLLARRPTG